ncbi:unnamed protein product [Symbiodinium natans]|uniref:Uncharacterized protein n=1 Tax=Symbiodinium natans TaxID=878477 RepID=A0A812ILH0_9DINO|nr:unnamed protein product [Symbiodinium natans]
MDIRPSNVRFSHDSISHRFSCGRLLINTLAELESGRTHISVIPLMKVTRVGDLWFAYNGNRRLWVFKSLETKGFLRTIKVQVANQQIPRNRFTTDNMGVSVRVRGQPQLNLQSDTSSSSSSWKLWVCISDGRIEQSLLDSYDPESDEPDCLALNLDEPGYFLFRSDGSWKYRGMPDDMHDAIEEELQESDNDPSKVFCGSDGRYFIAFEQGNQIWDGASRSFSKAVRQGPAVEAVAFSPDGGYWLRREDGSTTWLRVPRSLDRLLESSEESPEYVSMSSIGGWFARFPDGSWEHRNIPASCAEALTLKGGPDVSCIR